MEKYGKIKNSKKTEIQKKTEETGNPEKSETLITIIV